MSVQNYSETLMDHFQSPRNRESIPDADAVGISGTPGQGPYMVLYVRMDGNRIADAFFQCNGCGVTIACGSMLTDLVEGMSLTECRKLTPERLIETFDRIPVHKQDRAAFSLCALWNALDQIEGKDEGRSDTELRRSVEKKENRK